MTQSPLLTYIEQVRAKAAPKHTLISASDVRKLLSVIEVLREEVMRLEVESWAEFHRNTCLKSRGCHCKAIKNDALDKADQIASAP